MLILEYVCDYYSLWDLEESPHGVFSKQWRSAVGNFDGSDSQGPHICPVVIVAVQLLFTGYHLTVGVADDISSEFGIKDDIIYHKA